MTERRLNLTYQLFAAAAAAALKPQPWWKASDVYHISEKAHSQRRGSTARHTMWLFKMSSAWVSSYFAHGQKQWLPYKNKPVGIHSEERWQWLTAGWLLFTSWCARWGEQESIQKLCEGEGNKRDVGRKSQSEVVQRRLVWGANITLKAKYFILIS